MLHKDIQSKIVLDKLIGKVDQSNRIFTQPQERVQKRVQNSESTFLKGQIKNLNP